MTESLNFKEMFMLKINFLIKIFQRQDAFIIGSRELTNPLSIFDSSNKNYKNTIS